MQDQTHNPLWTTAQEKKKKKHNCEPCLSGSKAEFLEFIYLFMDDILACMLAGEFKKLLS